MAVEDDWFSRKRRSWRKGKKSGYWFWLIVVKKALAVVCMLPHKDNSAKINGTIREIALHLMEAC